MTLPGLLGLTLHKSEHDEDRLQPEMLPGELVPRAWLCPGGSVSACDEVIGGGTAACLLVKQMNSVNTLNSHRTEEEQPHAAASLWGQFMRP